MDKNFLSFKRVVMSALTAIIIIAQSSRGYAITPVDVFKELSNGGNVLVEIYEGEPIAYNNAVAVTAKESQSVFTDVKTSDWFYNDVMEAYKLGIIQGMGSGRYAPSKIISYAEYITVLTRVLGEEVREMREGDHWATPYMEVALKKGIITQSELSKLDLDSGIPRQDMVKFSCRALGVEPANSIEVIFDDLKGKSEQEVKYINAAFNEYLTEGVGRTPDGLRVFGYDRLSNRAELATMALRIRAYKENPVEYKKERAAAREAADKQWEEQQKKQQAELTWQELAKKGGITSESQLTDEVVEKIKSIKTPSNGYHVIGEKEGEKWTKPPREDINKAFKDAVKREFANEKSVVISDKLYYEIEYKYFTARYYRIIVNGNELYDVEVIYTDKDGKYNVTDVSIAIPVSDNMFNE